MRRETWPVVVIGGANGSGKTRLINALMTGQEDAFALVLERGSTAPQGAHALWSRRARRLNPEWVMTLRGQLKAAGAKRLYIELSESDDMPEVMRALERGGLRLDVRTVRFVSSEASWDRSDSDAWARLAVQWAESDGIVISADDRGIAASPEAVRQIVRCHAAMGRPGDIVRMPFDDERLSIYREDWWIGDAFAKNSLIMPLMISMIAFLSAMLLLREGQAFWNDFLLIALGMTLQSIPFLMVGILISAAIQVFVSREMMARLFERGGLIGQILYPILLGMGLPVCDCASVPVFRSLIQKDVPMPSAIIFLLLGPVFNPIALLATHYAFGFGRLFWLRILLSLLIAIAVGFSFRNERKETVFSSKGGLALGRYGSSAASETGRGAAVRGVQRFLDVALNEFHQVFPYLMLGITIFAALQMTLRRFPLTFDGTLMTVLAIGLMMLLAFALSLCSSSDSIVARSLTPFVPQSAVLAFLVFGPMVDYKNLLMMSVSFNRRFIIRLVARTTAAVLIALGAVVGLGVL